MSAYVFLGPTLAAHEARAQLDAIYLPPASEGDVYRAACKQPRAIGIVDGFFECVPAVWHKEVLWAMAEGIHVFGSASMGALRAAELEPFGMEGVGEIFEAYRDGILEDDDEVAVAHAPADRGYLPTSVAMVDIRATLSAAAKSGVIGSATRKRLEGIAKRLFYQDRSWEKILQAAAAEGMPRSELRAFADWLPGGFVSQKREDALKMLAVMRERLAAEPTRKQVRYAFQYTDVWDRARRSAGNLHAEAEQPPDAPRFDGLLDELRLEHFNWLQAQQGALARFLAVEEAWLQGIVVTPQGTEEVADAFRRERGLHDPESFQGWLDDNQLSHPNFIRMMEDEMRLRRVEALAETEVRAHLLDYLRRTGGYARLAARARDKEQVLKQAGLQTPTLAEAGITEEELLRWYFVERLGRPLPPELATHAQQLGFRDEAELQRALLREYCYVTRKR